MFFFLDQKETCQFLLSVLIPSSSLFLYPLLYTVRRENGRQSWCRGLCPAQVNSYSEALWRIPSLDWNQYNTVLIFSFETDLLLTSSFHQWVLQDVKIKHGECFHVQTSKKRHETEKHSWLALVNLQTFAPLHWASWCTRLFILAMFESAACCRSHKLTKVTDSLVRREKMSRKERE